MNSPSGCIRLIIVDDKTELLNKEILSDPNVIWSDVRDVSPVLLEGVFQIFYREEDWRRINPSQLVMSIARLFHGTYPRTPSFTLSVHPFVADANKAKVIMMVMAKAVAVSSGKISGIVIEADEKLRRFAGGTVRQRCQPEPVTDKDDDDDEEDEGNDSNWGTFRGSWLDTPDDDDEDEDDDEDDDRPKHRHSGSFDASRSIRNAKHPKRDIKRHRIVIASKKDVDKDKKVIKAFLREFLPGKSKWIKDYRREVASRWIRALVVKEKEARRRQKEFEASAKKVKARRYAKKVEGFGGRLIAGRSYTSQFYDPNK